MRLLAQQLGPWDHKQIKVTSSVLGKEKKGGMAKSTQRDVCLILASGTSCCFLEEGDLIKMEGLSGKVCFRCC